MEKFSDDNPLEFIVDNFSNKKMQNKENVKELNVRVFSLKNKTTIEFSPHQNIIISYYIKALNHDIGLWVKKT